MPGCRRVGTPGAGGLARGGADSAGGASAAFQQQQQYLAVEHTRWTVSSPLVVTHSPQVASKGDAHMLINKSLSGTVSRTDVSALDDEGRRQEIARMLSGADVTDEARAQADRLLEGV